MDGLDYLKPIQIAEGVHWIGYSDDKANLHCNPYIIIDGEEAVVIDGGSRNEFSTVMLKVLRLGVNPKNIKALIYQHSDPDLCGSIPQFQTIINRDDLVLISEKTEHIFIQYYSSSQSNNLTIDKLGYEYSFSSGRKLQFIPIPFAHAPGNFMTYDTKTKTLFTSDIFGSYDQDWSLYQRLSEECVTCTPGETCHSRNGKCPINGILSFHRTIMPSLGALRHALGKVKSLDTDLIAPQHGSLIDRAFDRNIIIKHLESVEQVGFEYHIRGVKDESIYK
jgi:flavorubredoxin